MLASGCFSSYAAGYSPRVGEFHPDFTMPNIVDNKPVSLSQFRGKKVLLVHFASW
jgi:peroxiredoxin